MQTHETYELTLRILAGIAAAFYYISAASALLAKDKKRLNLILPAIGFLFNTAVIVLNFIENGYVPFVSTHQVMSFIGFCFPIAYLYMHFRYKADWMKGFFWICSAVFMTGMQFQPLEPREFPPALQSPFFIPHVAAYMLSYSLLAVSFVITIVWFFTKDEQKKQDYSLGIYRLISIAFPFVTTAMLLGALWADQVWGDFWAFDVKENWSLITWLFYALFLHAYRSPKFKKHCRWLSVAGFVSLFITFIGITLFQQLMGALGLDIAFNSQHVYNM